VSSGRTKANGFGVFVCWHIHMALVSSHNFRTQFLLLNLKLCRSDTKIQGPINPKLQLRQPTWTLLQLWWNFRTNRDVQNYSKLSTANRTIPWAWCIIFQVFLWILLRSCG
jgi:hypothetical protein